MSDLLARETSDVRAAEAVVLFCYQARKWVGAYAAALGGVDTLVFAGGLVKTFLQFAPESAMELACLASNRMCRATQELRR